MAKNSRPKALDRIAIVLVGTQNNGNIGSVARAMLNMGLRRLVLVDPSCDPYGEEAIRMARDGVRLIERAVVTDSLQDALAKFHHAVATTARKGKRRGPCYAPRQIAPELTERAKSNHVAIVFGPEDRGLSGEQLALCQASIHIPTAGFKSLNLAQAVLLVSYELLLAALDLPDAPLERPRGPNLGQKEAMFEDLRQSLLQIGYLDPNNPDHIMLDLRRLLDKASLSGREISILRGIARQMKWASDNSKEE